MLVVTVDVDLPANYSTGRGATRTVARMNLVDLAGAEKIEKTGAKGQQLKEGIAINQSLSALAKVINVLTEAAHAARPPKVGWKPP